MYILKRSRELDPFANFQLGGVATRALGGVYAQLMLSDASSLSM